MAYRNAGYIADAVLPRVMVSKAEFKYWRYPIEETLALPETREARPDAAPAAGSDREALPR